MRNGLQLTVTEALFPLETGAASFLYVHCIDECHQFNPLCRLLACVTAIVPAQNARVVNRQYLTQFLQGSSRYLLAEDDFLSEDLDWAGFAFETRTTRGSRYREVTPPTQNGKPDGAL